MRTYQTENREKARSLRKNMTKEEKRLWYCFLKTLPIVFHRQKPIGDYIVDFCCAEKKLIIELDGSQHYEDEVRCYDEVRDAYLQGCGYTVLRYPNLEVNRNFSVVCNDILNHLGLE